MQGPYSLPIISLMSYIRIAKRVEYNTTERGDLAVDIGSIVPPVSKTWEFDKREPL